MAIARVGERPPRAAGRLNERLAAGGVAVFLLLLPLTAPWPVYSGPPWGIGPGLTTTTLSVVPASAGVLALIAAGLLRRRPVRLGRAAAFLAPLLALALLGLATAPFALLPELAWYAALHWVIAVGAYLLLTQSAVPPERVVSILVAGLGVQALIGIGQFALGRSLGLIGEMPFGPGHPLTPLVRAADGRAWLRASGLMVNPNVLGGFLAVAILLALPLLRRLWVRAVWWLLWAGLLVTLSRSAWLALLLTAPPAIGWLAYRQPELRAALRSAVAGLICVLLLGAYWIAPPASARLQPPGSLSAIERGSLASREGSAQVALGVVAARPLTGVGAGNMTLLLAAQNDAHIYSHAHNVVLQLAAEVGVLGGAIWIWMWLAPAAWMWWRRHRLTGWGLVAGHAWLAMGVINLFDAYFWVLDAGRLLTMLVLALLSQAIAAGAEPAAEA